MTPPLQVAILIHAYAYIHTYIPISLLIYISHMSSAWGMITCVAELGVVHCDFNEFNLLVGTMTS